MEMHWWILLVGSAGALGVAIWLGARIAGRRAARHQLPRGRGGP